MSRKSILKNIRPIILAFISSIALCTTGSVSKQPTLLHMLNEETTGVTLPNFIVAIFLVILYVKNWNQFLAAKKRVTHIIAGIFSFFMLLGLSYSYNGNWDFLFYNQKQFVIATFTFIGYFILFDCIISLLYGHFAKKTYLKKVNPIAQKIISHGKRHYWLFAFLIISIFWLPFLIIYLPGSVPYDGAIQINMFYDIETMTNIHPWLLSVFIGSIVKPGNLVSDNFGIFLITIILWLIEVSCYSYVCKRIYMWKLPDIINLLSIAFFAILPVFGGYAQAVIKDSLFSALFALYMVLFIDLFIDNNKINSRKDILLLFAIGLLVCLTRNNGIFLVIPSYICTLFAYLKTNKKVAPILIVSTLVIYYIVESIIAPSLGIAACPKRVMFSIPFQQTARYLKEYPNDVTAEEKEIIDKVLDYSNIANNYNPEFSDPVINTYRPNTADENLKEYFKIWYKMLLRHPDAYFEATFHGGYGYIYPFHNCNIQGAYQFYSKDELLHINLPQAHYILPENLRFTIYQYAELWRDIPILAELVNPGAYTWFLILLIGYFIYLHRPKDVLVFVPPIINVLVCIASPVNGYVRYALPLMACMPILILYAYYKNQVINTTRKA